MSDCLDPLKKEVMSSTSSFLIHFLEQSSTEFMEDGITNFNNVWFDSIGANN